MLLQIDKENHRKGFTLIEFVIVILIMGILSGVVLTILRGPMIQFVQVEQRTNLVDIAETALLRMTREIRLALPNSVRISNGGPIANCNIGTPSTCALEFLRTLDGARYRRQGANRLKFNKVTDTFEYFGTMNNAATIDVTGATANPQNDCLADIIDCVVVFNTGQSGANAYSGNNIAGITGVTSIADGDATNNVTFSLTGALGITRFPNESPRQRFFIVDTPVSFICSGSQISRNFSYTITAAQSTAPGGTSNLLVNNITACTMDYDAGTSTRAGLVRLSITVRDNDLGQEVTLMQQAHVDNQP